MLHPDGIPEGRARLLDGNGDSRLGELLLEHSCQVVGAEAEDGLQRVWDLQSIGVAGLRQEGLRSLDIALPRLQIRGEVGIAERDDRIGSDGGEASVNDVDYLLAVERHLHRGDDARVGEGLDPHVADDTMPGGIGQRQRLVVGPFDRPA